MDLRLVGPYSRFEAPKQLMAFLGLVASEHSMGGRRRQGAITLTGNTHARRMLVESAWSYRYPARQTKHLKSKAVNASPEAKGVAWKTQVRLRGRNRSMTRAGKNTKLVCVVIVRELAGFLWDIVCREMPHPGANAGGERLSGGGLEHQPAAVMIRYGSGDAPNYRHIAAGHPPGPARPVRSLGLARRGRRRASDPRRRAMRRACGSSDPSARRAWGAQRGCRCGARASCLGTQVSAWTTRRATEAGTRRRRQILQTTSRSPD